MVRNRWLGLVVAVAILFATSAAPVQALRPAGDSAGAGASSAPAETASGSLFGSWAEAAWGWFVAMFAEENGSIVP